MGSWSRGRLFEVAESQAEAEFGWAVALEVVDVVARGESEENSGVLQSVFDDTGNSAGSASGLEGSLALDLEVGDFIDFVVSAQFEGAVIGSIQSG